MPWIESHAELIGHPKTRRLAKALGTTERDSIGLLHMLWHWAVKYAPDGDLSRFDDDEIAAAVEWEGDATLVLAALKAARFIDVNSQIHDWDEYTGKLIERREANAERMRLARANREAKRVVVPPLNGVHDTCDERAEHVLACVELPDHTGPTIPDLTGTQPEPDPTAFAATAATNARGAPHGRQPPSKNQARMRSPPDAKVDLWTRALEELALQTSAADYRTWFADARLLELEAERCVVGVADAELAAWLNGKCRALVRRVLEQLVGHVVAVDFQVAGGGP
jgi:hypothetical protein